MTKRKQSCQGGRKSAKLDLNVKHTLCVRMHTHQPDGECGVRTAPPAPEGRHEEGRGEAAQTETVTRCLQTEIRELQTKRNSHSKTTSVKLMKGRLSTVHTGTRQGARPQTGGSKRCPGEQDRELPQQHCRQRLGEARQRGRAATRRTQVPPRTKTGIPNANVPDDTASKYQNTDWQRQTRSKSRAHNRSGRR